MSGRAVCVSVWAIMAGIVVACGGGNAGGGRDASDQQADWSDRRGEEADLSPELEAGSVDAADAGDGAGEAADIAEELDGGPVDVADAADAPGDAGGDNADGTEEYHPSDVPASDEVDGSCPEDSSDFSDTPPPPPPLFDMSLIASQGAIQCSFTNEHPAFMDGVLLTAWHVSYLSYESVDGELHPILIQGYAAKPTLSPGKTPGVVLAHGLGGEAKEANALGHAALLDAMVLAYTGPGGGSTPENMSEGIPAMDQNGYRLFDTLTDLRGSWFWGHAVAGMRGLTCLETRDDVDGSKLGMTGFSAGGVATMLSAGVDARIKAAVPMSGTLAWAKAVEAPKAWQHNLLQAAGLTIESPEWLKLMEMIDPVAALSGTMAAVLMLNGTTDEFFPLTAHLACYTALPGEKRTSLSGNFDHGCYKLTGGEDPKVIEERADLHARGGSRLWFRHFFETDGDYSYLPAEPQVTVQPAGGISLVSAVVDGGGGYGVEEVTIWWSNDDAFLFFHDDLDSVGGGLYSKLVPLTLQANTVYFVDVQYKTPDLLFPERFTISSAPVIPAGFIPHIRDMGSCL